MIKLNFVSDGVEVYNWTGAGVLHATIKYGDDFKALKDVPAEELTKLSRLITLAMASLVSQDAIAAVKAARTELDEVGKPELIMPEEKKLVVPA